MTTTTTTANLSTPYAVYGTLRSGQHNADLWDGLAKSVRTDTLDGYRLVTNGGFPYALPAKGERIVIEIIRPIDDLKAQRLLRMNLDRLEGYPSFYDRYVVTSASGTDCWMYVPADDHDRLSRLTAVTDNDWLEHVLAPY